MSGMAVFKTKVQKFLDRAGLRGFPWASATILYTISYGWLFTVRDSLWADDWFLFVEFDFSNQGFAPWISIQVEAIKILGLTALRTIIFFSFLLSSMFLFGITRKISFLSLYGRRFVVSLFLLLPFNTARVSLMVFLYTMGHLIFFLAWYLLVGFRSQKITFLSLCLFFLSFQMHSLLVFYLLPVVHLCILSDVRNLRGLNFWLRKNVILVSLPLIYWILRSNLWPERVSYHEVSASRVSTSLDFVFAIVVICFGLYILQRRFQGELKKSIATIFVGVIAISAGIFAYIVYGFFPSNRSFFLKYFVIWLGRSDWYSRHQTLQPLGIAFLIVGMIGLLPDSIRWFSNRVQILVYGICVIFNLGFGFEYVVDYAKQREIVVQLKEIGKSDSVLSYKFIDQTTILNSRGRTYRYRDWYGLVSLSYDADLRYGTELNIEQSCKPTPDSRLVLIQGPETHWQALRNWVSGNDMGFNVTVDDTAGACRPEMVTNERVSGAIPILFYFTGSNG